MCVLLAGRLRDRPRVIDPLVHVCVPVWNMVIDTLGVPPSGVKETDEVSVNVDDFDSFAERVTVSSRVDVCVAVNVVVYDAFSVIELTVIVCVDEAESNVKVWSRVIVVLFEWLNSREKETVSVSVMFAVFRDMLRVEDMSIVSVRVTDCDEVPEMVSDELALSVGVIE